MPAVYRPRRPAATLLHRTVRENMETFIAQGIHEDDHASNIPRYVQAAFGDYFRCGILAHGFTRVYCAGCGHDFLVAFSCKGRDICPSCSTRRMVEAAAHMVDEMDTVTQQNAARAEVTAAAAEEMSSQSTMLQSLVTNFRLKRAAGQQAVALQSEGLTPSHPGGTDQSSDWDAMDQNMIPAAQKPQAEDELVLSGLDDF